jgi:hypothetical protein
VWDVIRKRTHSFWRTARLDLGVATLCFVFAIVLIRRCVEADSKSLEYTLGLASIGALLAAGGSALYRALTRMEAYRQGAYTERAKAVQEVLQEARELKSLVAEFWDTRMAWYLVDTAPRQARGSNGLDPNSPDDVSAMVDNPVEASEISRIIEGIRHSQMIPRSVHDRTRIARSDRMDAWKGRMRDALQTDRDRVLKLAWYHRVWIGPRGERAVRAHLDESFKLRIVNYPIMPSGQTATAADVLALVEGVPAAIKAVQKQINAEFDVLEDALMSDLGYVPD